MQNQKNYQNFQDEQEYTGGIPVGQPVQYEMQPVPNQNQPPYFQQPPMNPYQNSNPYPNQMQPPQPIFSVNQPVQAPMVIQPHNSKIYNNSINVRCQCCKQMVQTVVNKEAGNIAHAWAFAICCFVGQCCCVPYLFDDCLDKTHYCTNCGQTIIRKHAKCFDIIN